MTFSKPKARVRQWEGSCCYSRIVEEWMEHLLKDDFMWVYINVEQFVFEEMLAPAVHLEKDLVHV